MLVWVLGLRLHWFLPMSKSLWNLTVKNSSIHLQLILQHKVLWICTLCFCRWNTEVPVDHCMLSIYRVWWIWALRLRQWNLRVTFVLLPVYYDTVLNCAFPQVLLLNYCTGWNTLGLKFAGTRLSMFQKWKDGVLKTELYEDWSFECSDEEISSVFACH